MLDYIIAIILNTGQVNRIAFVIKRSKKRVISIPDQVCGEETPANA